MGCSASKQQHHGHDPSLDDSIHVMLRRDQKKSQGAAVVVRAQPPRQPSHGSTTSATHVVHNFCSGTASDTDSCGLCCCGDSSSPSSPHHAAERRGIRHSIETLLFYSENRNNIIDPRDMELIARDHRRSRDRPRSSFYNVRLCGTS